jgi:hypothetical protein
MTRHLAYRTKIRAVKAWAGNAYAHLGRKEPKMMIVVYLNRTVMRIFWRNKNGAPAERPQTLAHSYSHPRLCQNRERERGDRPARGAAPPASPFASVRRSPEGERAVVEPARGGALSRDPRAQH